MRHRVDKPLWSAFRAWGLVSKRVNNHTKPYSHFSDSFGKPYKQSVREAEELVVYICYELKAEDELKSGMEDGLGCIRHRAVREWIRTSGCRSIE